MELTAQRVIADIVAVRDACIPDGGADAMKFRLGCNQLVGRYPKKMFTERVEVRLDVNFLRVSMQSSLGIGRREQARITENAATRW